MPTLVASQERTLVGGTYTFKSTQNLDLIDAAGIHAQQHRMTPLPEDAKEKRRWWDELGWRDRLVERLIAAKGVVRSQKDLGPSMDTIDRPKSFSLDSIFNGQMVEEAGVIAGSDRYREIVALAQLPGYGISRAAQCWERGVQTFDARKDEIGSNRRRRGQEDHDEEVEIEDAQLRWIEDPCESSIPIEKADLAAALIQLWCNKFLDGDQKVYQAGSIGRRRSDSQDVDLVVSKDVWTREDVDQFKSKIEADQTLLGPVYRHKRAAPFKMGAIPLNNPFIGEGSDLLKIAVELEGRRYMFDLFLVETGSLPTTLFYLRSSARYAKALFQIGLSSGFVVHPTGMYTFGEWEKGADEAEKIVVKEEHEIWARLGIAYQDTEDRSVDASKDGLPWNGGRKLETRGRTVKGSSGSLQGGAKRGKGTKKGAKRVIEDVAVESTGKGEASKRAKKSGGRRAQGELEQARAGEEAGRDQDGDETMGTEGGGRTAGSKGRPRGGESGAQDGGSRDGNGEGAKAEKTGPRRHSTRVRRKPVRSHMVEDVEMEFDSD